MKEFIYDSWNSVMDAKHNPLRHIKDIQVRHLVLQVLAWMWCIIFAIMVGSWTVWGNKCYCTHCFHCGNCAYSCSV